MSILSEPTPGNLIFAIMFREDEILSKTVNGLKSIYGQFDMKSAPYDFSAISSYYDEEMGNGIKKQIFSVESLLPRDRLSDAKLHAVSLEEKLSTSENRRRVNIDPGLVTLENFLLATGKNFSHRIYLGKGVFAEVTMFLGKKKTTELPWTYRDYKKPEIKKFLLEARTSYHEKLSEKGFI
ncbi:MAG: DUF4416 family protein [bacterium]